MTDPAGQRITYGYDPVGNRAALRDPDGGRFSYSYDPADRISLLVNPQGDRTSYAYDAAGRRTLTRLAHGTRASLAYDAAGQTTQVANLRSDGSLSDICRAVVPRLCRQPLHILLNKGVRMWKRRSQG